MNGKGPTVAIKCLPVTQPLGTFYIGTMAARDLVDIAWADVRRIAHDDEELGHQRDEDAVLAKYRSLRD